MTDGMNDNAGRPEPNGSPEGISVSEDQIPIHLKSLDERLQYFRAQVLSHKRLTWMRSQLLEAISDVRDAGDDNDARMIFLYGPTRVGKTTLLKRIERAYAENQRKAIADGTWNPGHIPLLRLAIPATGASPVSFRDIYKRMLQAADEPLIDQKRALERAQSWRSRIGSGNASEADLRRAVESMLIHRRPAVILLDEAQHLAERRGVEAIDAQLNCLKSLSNVEVIAYVLVGSYELVDYQNRNAQLSARSRYLHFSRYQLEHEEDVEEFKRVVRSFGARLPFEQPVDLEKHWRLLYRHSGGIVGIVKTWLYRALKLALKEHATTLTKDHLERSKYETSQLAKIIDQASSGETKLTKASNNDVQREIDKKIGFARLSKPTKRNPAQQSSDPAQETVNPENTQSEATTEAAMLASQELNIDDTKVIEEEPLPPLPKDKQKRTRKPGERNPKRDQIGLPPNFDAGTTYRI